MIFRDFWSIFELILVREIGYNVYAEDLLMQNPAGTEFLFEYEIDQTIKEGISDDYLIKIAIPEGATILDVRNHHPTAQPAPSTPKNAQNPTKKIEKKAIKFQLF